MHICKVCSGGFNLVSSVPYILRCGHTFCELCISRALIGSGTFECANCNYSITGIQELIINHILCDKTSVVVDCEKPAGERLVEAFRERSSVVKTVAKQTDPLADGNDHGLRPRRDKLAGVANSELAREGAGLKAFTSAGKREGVGVYRDADDETPTQTSAFSRSLFAASRDCESPRALNHQSHSITPQKSLATVHKIGFRTPLRAGGDDRREKASLRQPVSALQQLGKTKSSNSFFKWTKCANPDCSNPRQIIGSQEFRFCGMRCEQTVGGTAFFRNFPAKG